MNKTIDKDDLGIYVWTSDKNMVCLPAWAYLFNKFWPHETSVRVLGYSTPSFDLPKNFQFISLGKQRGPEFWSDDMIGYYESCAHDYFYAMWEDGFIIDYVDKEILTLATKVAFLNPNDKFLRFNLSLDTHRRKHSIVKSYDNYDLILADQYSQYRQSTNHSIWSKEKFLSKLKKRQSPWEFELDNKISMNDGLMVFATKKKYAIRMGHGYKRGKKMPHWYDENSGSKEVAVGSGSRLSDIDIEYIEANGWMPEVL